MKGQPSISPPEMYRVTIQYRPSQVNRKFLPRSGIFFKEKVWCSSLTSEKPIWASYIRFSGKIRLNFSDANKNEGSGIEYTTRRKGTLSSLRLKKKLGKSESVPNLSSSALFCIMLLKYHT